MSEAKNYETADFFTKMRDTSISQDMFSAEEIQDVQIDYSSDSESNKIDCLEPSVMCYHHVYITFKNGKTYSYACPSHIIYKEQQNIYNKLPPCQKQHIYEKRESYCKYRDLTEEEKTIKK